MWPLKIKVGVTGHSCPLSSFFQNCKCSLYLLRSKQLFEQRKDTYACWQSFFKIKKSQTKSRFLYQDLQWGNNHTKHLLPGLIVSVSPLPFSSRLSDFEFSFLVASLELFSRSLICLRCFLTVFSKSFTFACKPIVGLVTNVFVVFLVVFICFPVFSDANFSFSSLILWILFSNSSFFFAKIYFLLLQNPSLFLSPHNEGNCKTHLPIN